MLASTIITDVRRELLETTGAFWSDAELLRHLNRAQNDYVNRTRILEDTAFLSTTAGRADYQLPENWISAKLVLFNAKDNDTDNDSWQRLYPTSLEKMGQETPNFLSDATESRGTPSKYFIWNKRMYLDPKPDTKIASDLYLFYKAKPVEITALTQSIEIDDSLAEGLNAYILWKAWSKSKETALADEQKEIYANYIGEGRRWAKRRSGDQRNKVDIESATPFNTTRPFGFLP